MHAALPSLKTPISVGAAAQGGGAVTVHRGVGLKDMVIGHGGVRWTWGSERSFSALMIL